MSCRELSESFLFLANNGVTYPESVYFSQPYEKNQQYADMRLYDEPANSLSRWAACKVVGGGNGSASGKVQYRVWSPTQQEGKLYKGMLFLEEFTTKTKLSIFKRDEIRNMIEQTKIISPGKPRYSFLKLTKSPFKHWL